MEKYSVWNRELIEVTLDVTIAACKRFGADHAERAISACGDGLRAGYSGDELISYVLFETNKKVKLTVDDIKFIKDLMYAGRELNRGIGALRFLVQQENKNGGVIDVG
jgi:hypothetical protein